MYIRSFLNVHRLCNSSLPVGHLLQRSAIAMGYAYVISSNLHHHTLAVTTQTYEHKAMSALRSEGHPACLCRPIAGRSVAGRSQWSLPLWRSQSQGGSEVPMCPLASTYRPCIPCLAIHACQTLQGLQPVLPPSFRILQWSPPCCG